MDERVFKIKIGCPVPDWDAKHRLPMTGCIGPESKDSATIYRINSIFMDVSDQPHMMRQWLAGGTFTAGLFATVFLIFFLYVVCHSWEAHWGFALSSASFEFFAAAIGFGYVCVKYGRDEIFSLTRRPIRFHRAAKKIFAIRRRRFASAQVLGDITVEVPWNAEAVFCVHRGKHNSDHADSYHIRYYQVDSAGIVLGGFAIGREWDGLDGMNDLLCQWNYWCWFMNQGPAELPKPLLFLTERETFFESFLYCMYEVGFGLSAGLRIAFMPFFLWLTFLRVSSLATCRGPIWPPAIRDICQVASEDSYRQPCGDTPVGWAATSQAHKAQTYPCDPRRKTPGWHGETDSFKIAELWRGEVAPGNGRGAS
ncbi:hypothetical protein FHW58_002990 [Duganella sp. 1224]|uniref:DUF6708 domain-containing protein n=1 Tax=Duganella sp. 1224 TaxID=2587052 RepID=UPI0015CBF221|nr:DUF6708 domain-containing protein [Duganella sp. 1224]NYE61783.1 hypothetical protein [Duganella sp. 1224]